MRQRLGILIGIVLLVLLLIGLNAATFVQQEKTPDSELRPNRSSFNSGATGTQALFTLLSEMGQNVVRWREPMDALKSRRHNPAVLVLVGRPRRTLDEAEVQHILAWVNDGGRLVLIDRDPDERFLAALTDWKVVTDTNDTELMLGVDPYDQKQMTLDMPASRPAQPSTFTAGVNAVQTSRFASHIAFSKITGETGPGNSIGGPGTSMLDAVRSSTTPSENTQDPPISGTHSSSGSKIMPASEEREPPPAYSVTIPSNAPMVHLTGSGRNILVDAKYGFGSIVFLSDPWVVSNAGIGAVDNVQLAVNVVNADGVVAFDEYHQGYGTNENRFFQYFAGTPVIAIFLQLAAIAGFVLYSQSRRFARPVPEREEDRRTKLEYVAAMAELQQRTRAYDLVLENIYSEFRRRVCRLLGLDAISTNRRQLADMIGDRLKREPRQIEDLLQRCEDIMYGEPVKGRQALDAAAGLRELEDRLGITRGRVARRSG